MESFEVWVRPEQGDRFAARRRAAVVSGCALVGLAAFAALASGRGARTSLASSGASVDGTLGDAERQTRQYDSSAVARLTAGREVDVATLSPNLQLKALGNEYQQLKEWTQKLHTGGQDFDRLLASGPLSPPRTARAPKAEGGRPVVDEAAGNGGGFIQGLLSTLGGAHRARTGQGSDGLAGKLLAGRRSAMEAAGDGGQGAESESEEIDQEEAALRDRIGGLEQKDGDDEFLGQ